MKAHQRSHILKPQEGAAESALDQFVATSLSQISIRLCSQRYLHYRQGHAHRFLEFLAMARTPRVILFGALSHALASSNYLHATFVAARRRLLEKRILEPLKPYVNSHA